jgi:hypothetical protein
MKWPQEAQKAHKGPNRFTGVSGVNGESETNFCFLLRNGLGIHYVPFEPLVVMALDEIHIRAIREIRG